MEGEDKRVDSKNSFSNASILKRILICAAGAIVNIIFAISVYYTLMFSNGIYLSNIIESVVDDTEYTANILGLESGDEIYEINGNRIKNKYDYDEAIENITNEEIELSIIKDEEVTTFKTTLTEENYRTIGLYIAEGAKVAYVEKGSISEEKGIEVGDIVISINGTDVNGDASLVVELIQSIDDENLESSVNIVLQRDAEVFEVNIIPQIYAKYYLGVTFKEAEDTVINKMIYAKEETIIFLESVIDNMKQLFTGNIAVNQMVGPVGISEMVSNTDGIYEFIYLLALISLSLGVTNLLPIPALDGGKILILIIEAIRRKPMKQEHEINITLLGFTILICLSIYVTYMDILRIF